MIKDINGQEVVGISIKKGIFIEGVVIKKLRLIPDERGFLMEILRNDDPFYQKFGQAYITAVYPGIVKGWHYHKIQTDHFVIIKGVVKVVLYDLRQDKPSFSSVMEFIMSEQNPFLLTIPPYVCHGMKGIGLEMGYILNIPTEAYNYSHPDEFRFDPRDTNIPYDWWAPVDK